jgi:hypothetical protein
MSLTQGNHIRSKARSRWKASVLAAAPQVLRSLLSSLLSLSLLSSSFLKAWEGQRPSLSLELGSTLEGG